MNRFHIKEGYIERLNNFYFDDTNETDGWQKEVYEYAEYVAKELGHKKVCDFGTGSAYKLLKHFGGEPYETLGIDLPPTIAILRNRYPTRKWQDDITPLHPGSYDLIIASDVIEHMPDPTELLDFIETSRPKDIIFSTPDRDLLWAAVQNGPPHNPAHVREWSSQELYSYISARFNVINHFISNREQFTQLLHCRLRS